MWRQRCAHCWPVRPGISSATVAQRLPYFAWGYGRWRYRELPRSCRIAKSRASGQTRRARVGGGGWAYLEAGEDDVLGVGPWRALEVNGVGHEGCLGC